MLVPCQSFKIQLARSSRKTGKVATFRTYHTESVVPTVDKVRLSTQDWSVSRSSSTRKYSKLRVFTEEAYRDFKWIILAWLVLQQTAEGNI